MGKTGNLMNENLSFPKFSLAPSSQGEFSSFLDDAYQDSYRPLSVTQRNEKRSDSLASLSFNSLAGLHSQNDGEIVDDDLQLKSKHGIDSLTPVMNLEKDLIDSFQLLLFLDSDDCNKFPDNIALADQSTQSFSTASNFPFETLESSASDDASTTYHSQNSTTLFSIAPQESRSIEHNLSEGQNAFQMDRSLDQLVHPTLSRRKVQYRKTRLCPWYFSGRCVMKDQCNYAHSQKELRGRPDLTRTKICPRMDTCSNPSCRFAHYSSELRATEAFFKTKICKFWQQGFCSAGDECRHAHGYDQLRSSVEGTNCPTPPLSIPGDSLRAYSYTNQKEIIDYDKMIPDIAIPNRFVNVSERKSQSDTCYPYSDESILPYNRYNIY